MTTQQRKFIPRKSRAKKRKTEETSLHDQGRRTVAEEAQAGSDDLDERMSAILGERRAHQVISDTRLWDDNRQEGGE